MSFSGKRKRPTRPHGELRQSQLITTFGPGAMLDLPHHSVLVGGLEFWKPLGDEIVEPRLTEKLCLQLNVPTLQLRFPPPAQDDPNGPPTGITAWQFPEWFVTQDTEPQEEGGKINRSRMLIHRREIQQGNKFIDDNKKKRPMVPIRFVRACRAGHIGDIDWQAFVHESSSDCRGRRLWIDERGTSGDLSEVYVRCECGKSRSMAVAAVYSNKVFGKCDGNRPWLGPHTKENCNNDSRLLIRTASNAYFTQTLSVISLPDRNESLQQAIDSVWDFLAEVNDLETLKYERKKARVNAALNGIGDQEALNAIQSRRSGTQGEQLSVKQAELQTLISANDETGEDRPDGIFYARNLPREQWDRPWMSPIERVVLVHRLREVTALFGFTRFEGFAPNIEGEFDIGVRRAAIATEITWLPALENKGEGIFLQFSKEMVEAWMSRPSVMTRAKQLEAGHDSWCREHTGSMRKFVGLPYIMLHSFAHMLITAVALECGYPASSIRERIYALKDIGYGILLYTGTTDAEGTLGGLIQVGKRIHEHIRNALEMGELCSSDPVCAQHVPQNQHERRYLHGAACHGCLLIAETSCEQRNDFLDRALVVPTVTQNDSHFFPWPTP